MRNEPHFTTSTALTRLHPLEEFFQRQAGIRARATRQMLSHHILPFTRVCVAAKVPGPPCLSPGKIGCQGTPAPYKRRLIYRLPAY